MVRPNDERTFKPDGSDAAAMKAWTACLVQLAGCADPAAVSEEVRGGHPCDYELDDYVGGSKHLQIQWDLAGHDQRVASEIPMTVQLFDGSDLVAWGTTTTECLIIAMDGMDATHIRADGHNTYCSWHGEKAYAYAEGFETVKVNVTRICG